MVILLWLGMSILELGPNAIVCPYLNFISDCDFMTEIGPKTHGKFMTVEEVFVDLRSIELRNWLNVLVKMEKSISRGVLHLVYCIERMRS